MTTGQQQESRALAEWRAEIRAWLEANVPEGGLPDPEAGAILEEHRAWERTLFEAGYAALHWPVEYGGKGADLDARIVFQEEYERAGAPLRMNLGGLMLAGPTIMKYGTLEQKEFWLPAILRCDHLWCQGFSEPGAGSDLAGLRTSAVVDGEDLVVNGQKIWTSGGLHADWMFAMVRTGDPQSGHRGITYVMIDMRTPGIDVRPITQINRQTGFCEVFFTDVRVPLANVMGELDGGWQVAMEALAHERGAGRRTYVTFLNDLAQIRRFVTALGQEDDTAVREDLGRLLTAVTVYRHHVGRTVADAMRGHVGPEASYNKLYWSEMNAQIHEVGMRVLAGRAELQDDEKSLPGAEKWQDAYWFSRAPRIFAGTNQIQKNIISERVLGLPKEPRR
ncbi:acyl-CoA dehydrogenase family protein [Blastococcus sp. TF02A-30]|uniref:acyl-CoA dehydrogenase family protein n=1 Tax=Blastococcus sp. TF02A-30 TaxID=2250580 RepID=UPI000DEA4AD6|nr:acyl-CoA dehydrogenase family protein [Blastococcus sp. TF02A-30]RBY92980.1 acyl-CoA dehydrogenase [Blastococcus sp. TF02A-30]